MEFPVLEEVEVIGEAHATDDASLCGVVLVVVGVRELLNVIVEGSYRMFLGVMLKGEFG